jgi:hypothetical protein
MVFPYLSFFFLVCKGVGSKDRRMWSNPEILFNDNGLRLEFLEEANLDTIFKLVESSTSPEGYVKIRDAMKTNHFLGDLVNSRPILNEFSYKYLSPFSHCPYFWLNRGVGQILMVVFVFLGRLRRRGLGDGSCMAIICV